MIELFDHNKAAYQAAIQMLAESGKAAVIHPTGTGKSYIAFKLCVDHPEATICWLSPSRYIFDVQMKNLRKSSGITPENICFFTYAKLSQMAKKEMEEIQPDYLILDEFHRCGAAVWGMGVQELLNRYPGVPVLGLSATNIRYLDNQRDMADELFDGNIASQMTLGEAIVQGILKPPTYVTALYRYQKDFERIQHRIHSARDKIVRDAGEKYLELLKRTLEKSQGLEEIFPKYMKNTSGKYLIFCASKEHMDEMQTHVGEWFGRIDAEPHVYCAYSSDPETSKAFASFVTDTSQHLKLLFCIDMLNEGVHVEDVAGVILFRPTVSPIVYKQQIGRAMSAGSEDGALILDIVDNLSGLYSIGAIQEEMQEAIEVYQMDGENDKIVNETFRIIDEARDCQKIFDELEGTLSTSWDLMYYQAELYFRSNKNLDIPSFYVNPDGYPLGHWLQTQRSLYRLSSGSALSEDQISRLNAIGMDWRTQKERQWDVHYRQAAQYYREHGSLSVPKSLRSNAEIRALAAWIQHQRIAYRDGQLSNLQIQKLEDLEIVWSSEETWNVGYEHAAAYFQEFGNLDVPAAYVCPDGYRLGVWYRGVRNSKLRNTLPAEKIERLEAIGISWDSVNSRKWMQYFNAAKQYSEEHGDLAVHAKYKTEDGLFLGSWISGNRYAYSKGKLTQEQIRLLESIGMSWQQFSNKWNYGYEKAAEYCDIHGDCNVPVSYLTEDGYKLGAWVASQRTRYKQGKLIPARIEKLEQLHITWNLEQDQWSQNYEAAKAYFDKRGDLLVPGRYVTESGLKLGAWILTQRRAYRTDKLVSDRVTALKKIGMIWDVDQYQWDIGFSHLQAYKSEFNTIKVPAKFLCADGYSLAEWVNTQKRAYKASTLNDQRLKKLLEIGFQF